MVCREEEQHVLGGLTFYFNVHFRYSLMAVNVSDVLLQQIVTRISIDGSPSGVILKFSPTLIMVAFFASGGIWHWNPKSDSVLVESILFLCSKLTGESLI